ncbi:MAG: Phytanoyl-CoA dioxygenase, peroxisomal precursor, partial [uncultured Thermomicrobiales bacterium]
DRDPVVALGGAAPPVPGRGVPHRTRPLRRRRGRDAPRRVHGAARGRTGARVLRARARDRGRRRRAQAVPAGDAPAPLQRPRPALPARPSARRDPRRPLRRGAARGPEHGLFQAGRREGTGAPPGQLLPQGRAGDLHRGLGRARPDRPGERRSPGRPGHPPDGHLLSRGSGRGSLLHPRVRAGAARPRHGAGRPRARGRALLQRQPRPRLRAEPLGGPVPADVHRPLRRPLIGADVRLVPADPDDGRRRGDDGRQPRRRPLRHGGHRPPL